MDLVLAWNLNKGLLASKMGVNAYTFKMKLAGKPPYKFTEADMEKLTEALRQLASDIETVAGISFNNALAKMARKEA